MGWTFVEGWLLASSLCEPLPKVRSLTEALEGGTLSPPAREAVEDALQRAIAAVDMAIERLGSLAELVPEQARPYVDQAVALATTQLNLVKALLQGLFTQDDAPGGGTLPIPGGLPVPSGLQCNLPIRLPFTLPAC